MGHLLYVHTGCKRADLNSPSSASCLHYGHMIVPNVNWLLVYFDKFYDKSISDIFGDPLFLKIKINNNYSVYNLLRGKGPVIGDVISLTKLQAKLIETKMNGQDFTFNSIRINSPRDLLMNGKLLGDKCQMQVESHAENRL
jgi:hypothetical protein